MNHRNSILGASIKQRGVFVLSSKKHACEELLLDLIFYEIYCRRLSPEMEYLLERHLELCPTCRDRIIGFKSLLPNNEIVRNFG